MPGKVRVFCAMSLDGFIAGPGDDLSWLPEPDSSQPLNEGEGGFAQLMKEVGCILMGRNTYRIPEQWDGPWPYGETPVHVATSKPLTPKVPTVRPVGGSIEALVGGGLAVAAGKDLYIDGGNIIRQCLDAGLVDQMDLTIVPIVLGAGVSLFSGVEQRHHFELVEHRSVPPGLVELRLRRKSSD